jgi:hypothetical protein
VSGDLSDLLAPSARGPRCGVEKALERLSDPDRQLVADALAHPDGNARRIATFLRTRLEEGPTVQTVSRHRRGDCRCPRPSGD